MTDFYHHCSSERLKAILHADEESEDTRSTAAHLAACEACQQRLAELAADAEDWCEAREMLTGHEAAETNAMSRKPERCHHGWQHRPGAWTESSALQLLAPPSHPEMLGRIGRYEVERVIGSGGMGVVFKAFDTELNRPVAVKVLAPSLAGSGAARKRFAREARAAAAVVHEHVVAIHNVESNGEAPFLVMQYVAGQSLQQRLDGEGPLELCQILRVGIQTASGLAAAHTQGLVHRDVKPSNILLEQGIDRALLTDFGLARAGDDASLTHTGYHPGTPQYMSPEQARGDAVDVRSDLFSLGSVMYAMCTGRPPFRAETSYGILRRIIDTEPRPIREVNPQIPHWLERIVGRLLAKSPDERFQSAEQVVQLLQHCLAHVQQPTVTELPYPYRPGIFQRLATVKQMPRVAGTLLAVAVCGLIALCYGLAVWLAPDPVTRQAPGPSQNGSLRVPDTTATQPAQPRGTSTAWDGPAAELEALRSDLEPLERRSQRAWDLEPRTTQE